MCVYMHIYTHTHRNGYICAIYICIYKQGWTDGVKGMGLGRAQCARPDMHDSVTRLRG